MLTPPRENIRASFINAAFIAAFFCLLAWAQTDDAQAGAEQQIPEAQHSRDFVASQVCQGRAFEWADDKTLVCFKEQP